MLSRIAAITEEMMQTFLPFPDLDRSLETLDYRRLGKQRVEALQILNTLRGQSRGWQNHPAVRMWAGYETALALYMNKSIEHWKSRGYRNTMKLAEIQGTISYPPWFGNPEFHRSHQSNLVRKLPEHYSRLFPGVPSDLPYIWPA